MVTAGGSDGHPRWPPGSAITSGPCASGSPSRQFKLRRTRQHAAGVLLSTWEAQSKTVAFCGILLHRPPLSRSTGKVPSTPWYEVSVVASFRGVHASGMALAMLPTPRIARARGRSRHPGGGRSGAIAWCFRDAERPLHHDCRPPAVGIDPLRCVRLDARPPPHEQSVDADTVSPGGGNEVVVVAEIIGTG